MLRDAHGAIGLREGRAGKRLEAARDALRQDPDRAGLGILDLFAFAAGRFRPATDAEEIELEASATLLAETLSMVRTYLTAGKRT